MIKNIISGFRKYLEELNHLSYKTGISRLYLYFDCLWSWLRYGCVINHYTEGFFYLRKGFERNNILTYRRWLKVMKFNDKEYFHLLGNKLDFCQFFKDYIGREFLNSKTMTIDDFRSIINRFDRVFVKPVEGLEGRGIRVISKCKDIEFLFSELKRGSFILEEPVFQHPDMVFGNRSVNTVRVYTVFDKKKGQSFCIATTLRAGVGDAVVDNSHAGGLSYEIDMETGIIDSRSWGHSHAGGFIHPNTEICMLGRKIPFWDEVKIMCQEAASRIPEVPFIGWDVAVTLDGPVLIEGNHDPDLDILEFVGKYGYYRTIMSHLS